MSDRQITVLQPRPVVNTTVVSPQVVSTVRGGQGRVTTAVSPLNRFQTVLTAPGGAQTVIQPGQGPSGPSGPSGPAGAPTFEVISQNIQSLPKTLIYVMGVLVQMVYDLGGGGQIVKTFNYVSGVLVSIVLSGDVPSGVALTKTLSYTGADLTGVAYA